MRVTFDTNVLVYSLNKRDPNHSAAVALLQHATYENSVQPMQIYGEFFHVVTRKYAYPADDTIAAIEKFRAIMSSTVADETDFGEALQTAARYRVQFWDALIWATARRVGSRVILTEDLPGISSLDGLTFVNPFDPANRDLIDLALPPLNP